MELLCSSAVSVLPCLLTAHRHTCSAHPPNPTAVNQHWHPGHRSKHPIVVRGTISTLSALLRPEHSNPIRHNSYPSFPLFFCIPRQKNPILHPLLCFIHPHYLALLISSPPTLTATPPFQTSTHVLLRWPENAFAYNHTGRVKWRWTIFPALSLGTAKLADI